MPAATTLPVGPIRTISFAPALLAAVRDGHKTVTRRRIAHAQLQATPAAYAFGGMNADEALFAAAAPNAGVSQPVTCPFGKPGDWLRVVEDPSLMLFIKHLHAEPVRALTEAGARAEGIVACPLPNDARPAPHQYGVYGACDTHPLQPSAVAAFQELLAGIYPTAWERNEWVWVIDFQCFNQGAPLLAGAGR